MKFLDSAKETNMLFGHPWFQVNALLLDEKEKILAKHGSVCFAGFTYGNIPTQNKNSKYLDLYFPDMLSAYLRQADSTYDGCCIREWVKALKQAGICRSANVKIVSSHYIDERGMLNTPYCYNMRSFITHGVRVRFDTTKTSMREIFYVGSFFREIAEHPAIVYNFFKLRRKMPSRPLWEKLYLAYVIPMSKSYKAYGQHTVTDSHFFWIKKSPEEYLNQIDSEKWPPFCESLSYLVYKGHSKPASAQYVFGTDSTGFHTYLTRKRLPSIVSSKYNYCPEYYNSFLSEDNFHKWAKICNKFPLFKKSGGF